MHEIFQNVPSILMARIGEHEPRVVRLLGGRPAKTMGI
jgi:hypothetical protein